MDSIASRAGRRLGLFLFCAMLAPPALAVLPFGQPNPDDPYDYAGYLFIQNGDCSSGSAPPELAAINFDCGAGNWKASDFRDASHPETASNPQELYGVVGPGLNRAWEVSTGRPDVTLAVLDSGILWQHPHPELVNKVRLNRGELPKPKCASGQVGNGADTKFGGYDCDGNGVFNVADYAADNRVHDANGNGILDPEDLILTFSDSTDGDGNGYVDDIAGWDFYENDNDPQDDVEYGHGTGEAQSSASEAGMSDAYCPNCMFIPLRVGSSFVADIDHYAQAVIYATDNGVSVVQEALGTINHTSFAQAANDYAYKHGVIIMASEADEAAGHHNWPAALDHRMVINSIRNSSFDPAVEPHSYLFFDGCTNYGGYTYVSIPSTRCSSEATGKSAGVSGDLVSAARNAVDRGNLTNYLDDNGAPTNFALSSEEMMQLWRIAADDIDFSSPCPTHYLCDQPPAGVTPVAQPNNYEVAFPDPSVRYQSVRGWDFFFGYGRANYNRLLHQVGREPASQCAAHPDELCAQDRIPPEADITSPLWWAQYPYKSDMTLLAPRDGASNAIVISGHVAANRVTVAGGSFDWILEWAPGAQAQSFPLGASPAAGSEETSSGPWTTIASGTGLQEAKNGELGRIAIDAIVAGQSAYTYPFTVDPTSSFEPEQYAIRLRLRVLARPLKAIDTVNNEAVFQKQIDVYPAMETVLRDDLGRNGARGGGSPSPSFHDLDGDGRDELIVASDDGFVHAYTNVITGDELPGWPVHTAPIASIPSGGSNNAYAHGAIARDYFTSILGGSMAVADLDDNGVEYVIAGDIDGRLYAWNPQGQLKPNFPVTVNYAISKEAPCGADTIPHCDDYLTTGKKRDVNNRRNPSISFAPAVGNLDRSYPGLEIVASVGDGHVYAWHADGTVVPGWPVVLRDPQTVTEMNPVTQFYKLADASHPKEQGMIIVTPSLGDLDGDGNLEVVVGANEEYVETPNANLPLSLIVQALAPLDLVEPGNTRLYVLHHDGFNHPANAPDVNASVAASPHTEDQAYLKGWPVKMALIATELLPDVGEGTNSPAALADIDGDGHPEIIAASAAGPAYIFNRDGSSFLGSSNGNTNTLSINPAAVDTPAFVAVGALSVGSIDGGSHLTVAGPGAGLQRVLDLALEEQQPEAQDHLSLWNATSGDYEPLAPVIVNDLQFFTQPVFADVTGDGLAEVIQGTAVNDTVVAGMSGNAQPTRYHSGGWTVSAAAVGAAPEGEAEITALSIATTTREGMLRLYRTGSDPRDCTALTQWPEYGHDAFHSGNYATDAERPYPLREVHLIQDGGGFRLQFLATGDDRDCGQAASYRVRLANASAPDDWNAALPIATPPVSGAPGTALSIALPALPEGGTLLVRAYDDANNGSAVAKVTLPSGPTPSPAALTVVVSAPVTLTKGSSTPAFSTVRLSNVGGDEARVDSLTLELSDPAPFAKLVVSSPDGQHVTINNPSAHPVFSFSPALDVPHGSIELTVEYDMKPASAASSGWNLLRTAQASSGATAMQATLLTFSLLLIAMLMLPRRAALPVVIALALLAGCGGGGKHGGTICTTPACTDDDNTGGGSGGGGNGGGGNGGGGGGGGGGQAGTVRLISVAAHDLGGAPLTPTGLPALLANVSP